MRYIQSFSTSGDVQTALDNGSLGKPYVAYIESDGAIDWNTMNKTDYSKKYLTFNIISGGTVNWQSNSKQKTIEYKINDGEWTSITSSYGNPPSINVNNGDTVILRGNNNTYESNNCSFAASSTAVFSVCGNIMSLVYGDDFNNKIELTSENTFSYLFKCTGLTSAENLVLPATALTNYCYDQMFSNCSSLATAPELPATTLANYCYASMFSNCSSLATAPELPATTLANNCYQRMFFQCTSLTTVPELPATTLANYCYNFMFSLCSSLNYIKCLATDISAYNCTSSWLYNVSSTGTFVKNASMTSWSTGSDGIPSGWTVQDA